MSQFFKALERAERDRALRQHAGQNETAVEAPVVEHAPPVLEVNRLGFDTLLDPEKPIVRPDELEGIDPHLVSILAPTEFQSEQYRVLRHVVEQSRQEDSTQVFGITSPGVQDGKTTTVINLAGAIAQAPDAQVLLIETDLRRPRLLAAFGMSGAVSKGIVDLVLNPSLPFEAGIVRLPQYNLALLPAGRPAPNNSYEILKSPSLARLFQAAKKQFQYIVVDMPPAVPLPDCRILQQWIEKVILVVCANRTPRRSIENSLEVFEPSKLLGLVFNGDERTASEYSQYYGHSNGTDSAWRTKLAGVFRGRFVRLAR
jgi:capsular exopolysaccharide synthesis family protein